MSEKNRDSGAESGRDSVPAPAAGPTGTGPIIDLTELVVRGDAALDVAAQGDAAQAEHAPETDTVSKIPDTAPLPSPLLAGMLPGLVERVSGLAHDLDVVRDKMEQISLRQNRIDQAQRRAASLGTCLPHAEELALLVTPMLDPLNARITALEGALEDRVQDRVQDHAAGTGKEGAAHDAAQNAAQQPEEGSCDISGISTRLNECEEQLALCVTRADLEQTCTAILDKHLPAAFEELAQAASGREADRTETADMEDQTGQLMNQSAHQRLDDISSRLQALENGLAAQADMAEAQCSEKLPEDMAEAVAAAGADTGADTVTAGCASAQPGQAQATALLAEHEAIFEGRLTALETSLAGVEEGLGELAAKLARGLEDLDSLSGRMQAVESSLASVLARDAAAAASEKNEAEDIAALAVRLDSLENWRAEEAVLREGLAESLADRAQELAALRRDAAGAGEGLVRRLDALEDTLAALTAAQEAAHDAAQEADQAADRESAQNAADAGEDLAGRLQALEDRLAAVTAAQNAAQEAARDAAQAAAVEAAQNAAGAEEGLARRLEALEDRLAALTAAQEAAREAEKTAEAAREAGQAAASPASLELLDKLAERQAGQDAELAALRESQTSARNSLSAVQETLSSKCDVLASRMAALEELLGEEHLERVAARACIRVLREEIASIMQAGK